MSINNPIPSDSEYIQPSSKFTANFNVPVLGKYSFNVAGNTNIVVLPLQLNTIYLIERISIAGDIPEDRYLEAMDNSLPVNSNPFLSLKYSIGTEHLHKFPLPVLNYTDDQELVIWCFTEKKNCNLIATFTGLLMQTAYLVGKSSINIVVSFSMYAISNTEFTKSFRGLVNKNIGKSLRG
jgi:hypothetical protein